MIRSFAHRIIFVRHGQTSFNAENRLQGQRDVPLDGKGREQARAVGRSVRIALAGDIAAMERREAFWASPLTRAKETIEHLVWEKLQWFDKYVKHAGPVTSRAE